ncbi:hypothetical protein R6Q59_026230 [Mikania micrantha]
MSNFTGDDGSFSSGNNEELETQTQNQLSELKTSFHGEINSLPPAKKKRNLPGTPDPKAEVIALSPSSLMATNRFVCEICSKGFQRDQNLQLHRRGHNLPWKLKQRPNSDARKRVYVCPESSCVHHNPARALGDLTGIKKHYSRKHGEKKWKCDRCSKKYAVQSDWKAHLKTCGTREYKCDCGTIFSRKDSFITHRAFCDALTEENNKLNQGTLQSQQISDHYSPSMPMDIGNSMPIGLSEFDDYDPTSPLKMHNPQENPKFYGSVNMSVGLFSSSSSTLYKNQRGASSSTSDLQLSSSNGPSGFENFLQDNRTGGPISEPMAHMSAKALLQKAAEIGVTTSNIINSPITQKSYVTSMTGPEKPDSNGPRPGSSNFDVQGPFSNIQAQPELGSNALQKPIGQYTFGLGPKPILDVDPVMNDQNIGLMNMEHGDGRLVNTEHGDGRHTYGGDGGGGGGGVSGNDTLIVDFWGIR